jgi:DMSO/TMAO reductase YedYZ molybdopterin-dependent catalytic subunit
MSSLRTLTSRRSFVGHVGLAGLGLAAAPAWAETIIKLPLPGGPQGRPITTDFPQKGAMILQRSRPPLLETPFEVFDKGIFTPNDQFFVRWHWADIPTEIDVQKYRLVVRGRVNQVLSLPLQDILAMPRMEIAAVNQCSGNSRGLFAPPVAGAQWANGAMGNARWTGVRLKDVLDRAGVTAGAVAVRFGGLDDALIEGAPKLMKSLDIDHARDGEVMIAYQMNGEQLPLLNGFPLRLIVPGWYSTYWVKMLSDIEVLSGSDDSYWMKTAYRIPDTPHASVMPGQTEYKTVPINRMAPRSFVTNLKNGDKVSPGGTVPVRGIAFGGDRGVKTVDVSIDGGANWSATELDSDAGPYSFRQWRARIIAATSGDFTLMSRCTNTADVSQPPNPNWNPGGFMRNVVEKVRLAVA